MVENIKDEMVEIKKKFGDVGIRVPSWLAHLMPPPPSPQLVQGVVQKVAEKIESGVIVTVFPDAGDKYLSERFWDER